MNSVNHVNIVNHVNSVNSVNSVNGVNGVNSVSSLLRGAFSISVGVFPFKVESFFLFSPPKEVQSKEVNWELFLADNKG